METQREFNEKLSKIEENAIFIVSKWWGVHDPGYAGTIITQNKELYSYQFYHFPQEPEKTNAITKIRELNVEEYNEVINFIENEIINKGISNEDLFDAGFKVTVNYNGTTKAIKNIDLYNKAKLLTDTLLKI